MGRQPKKFENLSDNPSFSSLDVSIDTPLEDRWRFRLLFFHSLERNGIQSLIFSRPVCRRRPPHSNQTVTLTSDFMWVDDLSNGIVYK
jgi:hypothetical protein